MPFTIHRGTNISHWLSQSDRRGTERQAWFTRDDVRRLAAFGLDHLRLPLDEEQLWAESGAREAEAWELMHACLEWCQAEKLRVVVDLHILRAHYFNAATTPRLFTDPAAAERFAWFWQELSGALRHWPTDQVAYELMNEPVATDNQDWNRVYRYPYEALRKLEPDRVIVLGSNRWSQACTFADLDVPTGDRNLILTFHYYNPMFITHYRAPWVKECKDYAGPVTYPGCPVPAAEFARLQATNPSLGAEWNRPYSAAVMKADLAPPLAVAARTGLPLYCGEFGVLHTVPAVPRTAWYRDFRGVLDQHGIAWANWDYKGGFGLVDGDGKPTAVVDGLLGPTRKRA